jgi:non-homologous end joining protein Ku
MALRMVRMILGATAMRATILAYSERASVDAALDYIGAELRLKCSIRDCLRDVSCLRLASHIVATKAGHFAPSKFDDRYEDALIR